MKNKLKFVTLFCLAVIVSTFFAVTVPASDYTSANPDTGFRLIVEDDAHLLNDLDSVVKSMQPITEYGHVMFKSVDVNNTTARSFAEEILHGNFGKESSTVFLIDMDNRKIFIYSDGRIYRTITSSKSEVITDNIYRYASNEEYDKCAIYAFEQMKTLLDGGKIAEPMHIIGIALISLLLGMIICFIVLWKSTKQVTVSPRTLIEGTDTSVSITPPVATYIQRNKKYSPVSSGGGYSGGGGSSGGGGGGGGGGGSSGGGGGHSF